MVATQLQMSCTLHQSTTQRPAFHGLPVLRRQEGGCRRMAHSRRSCVAVRAAAEKDPVVKIADSIGLPTQEGIFGFVPFSEVWVGRLAMLGFLSGLVGEFLTGKGILQQVGLFTPNPALLATIIFVTGGATIFAAGRTLSKAQTGQLTAAQLVRYRQFLGLQKENQNIEEEQERLKESFQTGKDVVSPDNFKTIAATKLEGTPADSLLGGGDTTPERESSPDAAWTRNEAAGPSQSLAGRDDVVEQSNFNSSDWAYARDIEVQNGRWAMLGFWGALVVEAATGEGIIGQCVGYLKATGLLGKASGF